MLICMLDRIPVMHGLETIARLNGEDKYTIDPVVLLRRAWAKVGKSERGSTGTCGICGCQSNLRRTVGNTMIGIKTVLVCPGRERFPELHEKIGKKQELLYDDALPSRVQEEIVLELLELRARIAVAGSDIV